jgi:acyl dehydratase
MAVRDFDDWAVGDTMETASLVVTRENALAFAREYDPQAFHLDDEVAARSPFGRLAISGWQTASYTMRLMVESGFFGDDGLVGLGLDALRWHEPVYPGDSLRVVSTVKRRRATPRKPTGVLYFANVAYNGHERKVLSYTSIALVARRL